MDTCLTYVGWYGGLFQDMSKTKDKYYSNYESGGYKLQRDDIPGGNFDSINGTLLNEDKKLTNRGNFGPDIDMGFSAEFWMYGTIKDNDQSKYIHKFQRSDSPTTEYWRFWKQGSNIILTTKYTTKTFSGALAAHSSS